MLMKAKHIVWFLLAAVLAVAAFIVYRPAGLEKSVDIHLAEESINRAPVQIAATEEPEIVEALEVVEKPSQPVQTLEERGDAMLFEIDALQGTPFDQAVVLPFD